MNAEDTRLSLNDFIARQGIRMSATQADRNPQMTNDDEWARKAHATHWRCSLSRRDESGKARRMTVYFSQGSGFGGREPEAANVLNSLALDSASVDNANDFEDWANEFGYDTDSRAALRSYRMSARLSVRLFNFLGDEAYQALLYETESL